MFRKFLTNSIRTRFDIMIKRVERIIVFTNHADLLQVDIIKNKIDRIMRKFLNQINSHILINFNCNDRQIFAQLKNFTIVDSFELFSFNVYIIVTNTKNSNDELFSTWDCYENEIVENIIAAKSTKKEKKRRIMKKKRWKLKIDDWENFDKTRFYLSFF